MAESLPEEIPQGLSELSRLRLFLRNCLEKLAGCKPRECTAYRVHKILSHCCTMPAVNKTFKQINQAIFCTKNYNDEQTKSNAPEPELISEDKGL